jgi:CBS domain-containing protein
MSIVGRICCRDVDTIDRRETVTNVARRMAARGVGTLVVLDDRERPLGLITDRDLAVRVLAETRDPATTPVEAVMTREPKTVTEDTPIEDALALMKSGGFRRLPVIDRSGKMIGMFSLTDVLALSAEEFTMIGGILERERPHQVR